MVITGLDEIRNSLPARDGHVRVVRRLSGGTRNDVYEIDVRGRRCVARRSKRSPAALAWELDLLERLLARDFIVPQLVRTSAGADSAGGVIVYEWIDGRPPESPGDWLAVVNELRRLHAAGRDCPQRPEFRSTRELLHEQSGGDVRLDLMPSSVVQRCRDAWRGIADEPQSLVHGDPRGNALMTATRVAFIDWDEARVDASVLDLADLPIDPAGADPARLVAARRAAHAWEAAVFWLESPSYAERRFAELSAMTR